MDSIHLEATVACLKLQTIGSIGLGASSLHATITKTKKFDFGKNMQITSPGKY